MSEKEIVLNRIGALQADLVGFANRLSELESEVRSGGFELISEPGAPSDSKPKSKGNPLSSSSQSSQPQPVAGPLVGAVGLDESLADNRLFREEAARETGRFFSRCLAGEPRGSSGRSKVRLQNRYYVVVRDIRGEVFEPVKVFSSFSEARALVSVGGNSSRFGDSIFAGFAELWEARASVAEAGLGWPPHLEQ